MEKITLDSLCIITDEYPKATTEAIKARYEEFMKEKDLDLNDYVMNPPRVVLCDYVAYVKIYHKDQIPLYTSENKEPAFTFTFNEEIYKNWEFVKGQERSIFCNRIMWSRGEEILTTLPDKEYLAELKKIENQLLNKYLSKDEIEQWKTDLKLEWEEKKHVKSFFINYPVFEKFSDLIKDLFIKEKLI